jgi:transcriptional regulator with XRE-family HTH domain
MVNVKRPNQPERQLTFLREWREFRDMTLEEAAERLEIHHTTLLRIEKRQSPYNQDFLERAALVYGCEPTDFLDNNPQSWNVPRLVYDRVKQASPDKQREVMAVIEAMLKAG